MSELWANRQRDTNRLVRLVAPFALSRRTTSPDQLYGLCKLTWITNNSLPVDAPYILSTKIPALGEVFEEDFSGLTLPQVAARIAAALKNPDAVEIVQRHTGFTNFYKAYRNAAREWVHQNARRLKPMFRQAFNLASDDEGVDLVGQIAKLEGIAKPNNSEIKMRPQYILTSTFFALDERLRFPMINGNDGVQRLLRAIGVAKAPLRVQYNSMIELYGQGGIVDAADLDQAGHDLPDFITTPSSSPTKQLLALKPTEGDELPLKDERDVESVQSAKTVSNRRLHNVLTNRLRAALSSFVLYEGRNKDIMFDVMVKKYNGHDDLLIEVKSSTEIAHIRMAVGQLYSYLYRLGPERQGHLTVLLPEKPQDDVSAWLDWLDIGLLWFSDDGLCSSNDWLRSIARVA
jgi:hypothetical protein